MPRLQMYVNSDVNVLSFEGSFVTLHLGTVLIVNVYCFLHLQRYKPIIIVPTFSFNFIHPAAKPFHRSDDKEGSRSIAERFVVVIRTKPSPAHVQRSMVTFTSCKHSNCVRTITMPLLISHIDLALNSIIRYILHAMCSLSVIGLAETNQST